MMKKQMTLRVIDILGPYHWYLDSTLPEFWTSEPVDDATVREALRNARGLRRTLEAAAGVVSDGGARREKHGMTRAQFTLQVIEILGQYHRHIDLTSPDIWSSEPVNDADASEGLQAAREMRLQFQWGVESSGAAA